MHRWHFLGDERWTSVDQGRPNLTVIRYTIHPLVPRANPCHLLFHDKRLPPLSTPWNCIDTYRFVTFSSTASGDSLTSCP